jgi:hypothetical protein
MLLEEVAQAVVVVLYFIKIPKLLLPEIHTQYTFPLVVGTPTSKLRLAVGRQMVKVGARTM